MAQNPVWEDFDPYASGQKQSGWQDFDPFTPVAKQNTPEPSLWDSLTNAWDTVKKVGIPTYNPLSGGVSPSHVYSDQNAPAWKEFGSGLVHAGVGMAQLATDPIGIAQQQAKQLGKQATSFIPGMADPNRIGSFAPDDPSLPFQSRLGMLGAEQLGYNPEAIMGNVVKHNYGQAFAGIAAPTIANWAMGQALHGTPPGKAAIPDHLNVNPGENFKLPGMASTDFNVGSEPPAYQRPFQFFEPANQQGSLNFGEMPDLQGNLPFDRYKVNGKVTKLSDMQNQAPDAFSGRLGPTVGELPDFSKQPTMGDMAPPTPAPTWGGITPEMRASLRALNIPDDIIDGMRPEVAQNIIKNAPTPDELGTPDSPTTSSQVSAAQSLMDQMRLPATNPDINGVRFLDDNTAVLTHPSTGNQAELAQLGFKSTRQSIPNRPGEPGGILFKYDPDPTLAETPFTQSITDAGKRKKSNVAQWNDKGELEVPASEVDTKMKDKLKSKGIIFDRVEGTVALFKRLAKDTKAEFTPMEMWDYLKSMLKREPTPAELSKAMENQVKEGETTGRLAAFPAETRDQYYTRTTGLPIEDYMMLSEQGREKVNAEYARSRGLESYGPQQFDDMPGPNDPMWSDAPKQPPTKYDPPADYRMVAAIQKSTNPAELLYDAQHWSTKSIELRKAGNETEAQFARYISEAASQRYKELTGRTNPPPTSGNRGLNLVKRLVTDESGTFDPVAMAQNMAERLQNLMRGQRENITRAEVDGPITREEFVVMDNALNAEYEALRHAGRNAEATASNNLRQEMHQRYRRIKEANAAPPSPSTGDPVMDHINRITDIDELIRLMDTYGSEHETIRRNTPDDRVRLNQVNNYFTAIGDRIDYLSGYTTQRPLPPTPRPLPTAPLPVIDPTDYYTMDRHSDLQVINNSMDINQLSTLRDHYASIFDAARAEGNTARMDNARDMRQRAEDVIDTLSQPGNTPPPTPVKNEPIIPGQYPTPKARLRIKDKGVQTDLEQKLLMSGKKNRNQAAKVDQADRPQYHPDGTPNPTSWDRWAADELQDVPDGPPGLSVEDNYARLYPSRASRGTEGYGRYHVIYRDPQGKAITLAEISEDANGKRHVEVLASDRYRGPLHARGVYAVGSKLVEYNALTVDGSFSQHTARILGKVVEMIKNQSGEANLGAMINKLQQIKQEMLSGKPWFKRTIKSPEDVGRMMDEMANPNFAKSVIQRFLNSDDTGSMGPVQGVLDKINEVADAPPKTADQKSYLRNMYDLTRTSTTTGDFSAALKQGSPHAFTKEWRDAFGKMVQAAGEEGAAQMSLDRLKQRPIFRKGTNLRTGEETPSFAEQAGMRLSELDEKIGPREELTAAPWVETGEMFGKDNIVQRSYQKTGGRYARASNRAYITFLNELRGQTFENLIMQAKKMYDEQTPVNQRPFFQRVFDDGKALRDPTTDLVFAKEIADFVNTTTGRGPLKTHVYLPTERGQIFSASGIKEINVDRYSKPFSEVMFAPRLIARTVRMLNPLTYVMASPMVRQQYLRAALRVAYIYGTAQVLGKVAGGDLEADPRSADFGKVRFGNLRLDPGQGFSQYLTPLAQLLGGHRISSSSGEDFTLGRGYKADTAKDVVIRSVTNKLHPVIKSIYDIAAASERQPFGVADRGFQLFAPMIVGDLLDIARKDPKLLPLMAPISLGMGSQMYDAGQTENKYFGQGGAFHMPDYNYTGNGLWGFLGGNQATVKRKGL